MKSGLKVRVDKANDVLAALKAIGRKDVLIGIPEEKSEREDIPFGNAGIGYINEYGSPAQNIPARPHLQPGVRSVQDETTQKLKQAAQAVFAGNTAAADRALNQAGAIAMNAVKRYIIVGNLTPLAPATLYARKHRKYAKRKGENPLIDTGKYREIITYIVRDKNAKS
ncbi:Uncharacterised protein [Yersinia pseudotuberculosis]|uniref:hypothetical protein n=1 Tax=Yersinia pseudotuberculosis TaxID=633 RepID=UPI0005DE6153|nr:hypothetical protein [Yersinia pseudotuberculosis]BCU90714.1 hypothetical protein YP72344_22090 [Yersinia pseudotuberculosis]CNF68998.1 Uncharacterised protein [Yersinia pseudotuberculosis]CNL20539.1 Uncharacterised protein [Yersinia pseudotuberculosis]